MRTEYEEIRNMSPYSVLMQENADQKSSEYGLFLLSVSLLGELIQPQVIPPRSSLLKKCPYVEIFWSLFSRIQKEYGELLLISPYSVRMRGTTNQKNSEYGQFSRSAFVNRMNFLFQLLIYTPGLYKLKFYIQKQPPEVFYEKRCF